MFEVDCLDDGIIDPTQKNCASMEPDLWYDEICVWRCLFSPEVGFETL